MGRYVRFALMLLAIAGAIAGFIGSARIANAQPHPVDVPVGQPHPISAPTPTPAPPAPHLPFGPNASPSPGASSLPWGDLPTINDMSIRMGTVNKALPKPKRVPKLSQFLVPIGKNTIGVRAIAPVGQQRLFTAMAAQSHHLPGLRPMNSAGGTIILTGDFTNYFENDLTLSYGSPIFAVCENMAPNTSYKYVVWTPDGSGPHVDGAAVTTDANGNCGSYETFNLSTPWGGFGGGAVGTVNGTAYPGVWVVALQNQTNNQYDSEVNIVANSSINFTTYANLGLTTPTYDFAPGSTIVVNATNLVATHNYAIGWVYTGGGNKTQASNLPCEIAKPVGASNSTNAVCFKSGATGLQAFGNQVTMEWTPTDAPSTNTAPTGTYDVELYDTTSNEMVGHQQISIEPNSVGWTLTPVNSSGATPPPGLNYNNIFATDGLTDQSVTGITYKATGLSAGSNGRNLILALSDPNGMVLQNNRAYPAILAPPTVTQAAGTITTTQQFPLNVQYQTAYGPTETPFAPNIFTAQLFDSALAGSVLGSKSFQILGYSGSLGWSVGSILNAGTTGTVGTVTITNTSGSNFGPWNGDAISGVTIATNPADGESLALSSTTAVDSGGNGWTIALQGAGVNAVIVATPNQRNVGIPVGGTLTFNLTATVPAGKCTTPCFLPTTILPEHGIAYSGADKVTNSLEVLAQGIPPASVSPTYTWKVTGEPTTPLLASRVGTFPLMTYIQGTSTSTAADTYNIDLTVNNTISPGGNKLMDLELVFPGAVDMNGRKPTVSSTTPNTYGTWTVVTNANEASLGGQNVLKLTCNPSSLNQCGVPQGSNMTFHLSVPIFQTSFAEQAIPATGNFDTNLICGGGCAGVSSYTFNPTTTTYNGIAGNANLASNELGAFSLNPTQMAMAFTPNTVGTGIATSATLSFTNTPTSHDPNPDWVDQINLIFPAAANPNNITVPAGWQAVQTSANHWQIALCAAPTATVPCSTNETANAVAPGGQLAMTLQYNAPGPAAGTYAVTWYATGANGGANTSGNVPVTTASITFSTTTASMAFTKIDGVAVPGGTEPQVGTDTAYPAGSTYVYSVVNTGSTNIDTVTVTIPHTTRSGSLGTDGATGNSGYYDITSAPTLAYANGAKSCTVAYTNPTAAADGNITLTGCTIPAGGGAVNITFNAQTPYLIGSEFVFPTTVKNGGTQVSAQSLYTASNVVSIVLSGTLTILTPAVGWVAPTQPNSVTPTAGSGAAPVTNCVSCIVTAGTPTTVDFGVFNGNFSATDVVDASVFSDANSPNNWVLYVTTAPGTNPSNMLATNIDVPTSSSTAGYTVNVPALTNVATTTPGLQLSTYTGSPYHKPIDSIMSYKVTTGGNTSPQIVTLTYTLVFN